MSDWDALVLLTVPCPGDLANMIWRLVALAVCFGMEIAALDSTWIDADINEGAQAQKWKVSTCTVLKYFFGGKLKGDFSIVPFLMA